MGVLTTQQITAWVLVLKAKLFLSGVVGILRDVFTMGARPIATLNSIHFGSHKHPKTKNLLNGVVSGIGGYGNCMGRHPAPSMGSLGGVLGSIHGSQA